MELRIFNDCMVAEILCGTIQGPRQMADGQVSQDQSAAFVCCSHVAEVYGDNQGQASV